MHRTGRCLILLTECISLARHVDSCREDYKILIAFPSITRHVQGLQRTGHVVIDPDPDDRRSYRIALTEAGTRMLGEFRDDLLARFAPVVESWDEAEVAALADGLTKLAAAMREARASAGQQPPRPHWWRDDAR